MGGDRLNRLIMQVSKVSILQTGKQRERGRERERGRKREREREREIGCTLNPMVSRTL